MKKRNYKILLAAVTLSVTASFMLNPFTATYASTISKNNNINLQLDGKNNVSSVSNNFTLTNKGNQIDLSEIKIRYYFTSDENSDGQAFACYYASLSGLNNKYKSITNSVHWEFKKLDSPEKDADSYVEISFDKDSGTFDSSDTLTLNTALNNKNWSAIKSDDDYSFNDSSKTVVLVNDKVFNGTAPESNISTSGFNTISDPLRSGINNDEANISFFSQYENDQLTLALTNTSNIDMDLGKLVLKYYYSDDCSGTVDNFILDNCSILENNKDLRSVCNIERFPFGLIGDYMWQKYLTASFNNNAGILKPGETLVLKGHHEGTCTTSPIEEPIVTYDNESLYGDRPDFYVRNSKILSDDITLNPANNSDTPINLELNGNALKSIDSYSEGNFVKTLEEGTDYILTNRNKVILTESYLDSVDKNITLDLKFSKGPDDTIDIKHHDLSLPNGALTIENAASLARGYQFVGCPYREWQEDLTIPVTLTDTADEKISSATLILKFDNYLFSNVKIDSLNSKVISSEVNYDLGIIKINLLIDKISNSKQTQDFNIVCTPTGHTDPQKVNLSLDNNSYYKTESGSIYKPVFKYNDLKLS